MGKLNTNELRNIIADKGFSVPEVAERVSKMTGKSTRTVGNWIYGSVIQIPDEGIKALSKVLSINEKRIKNAIKAEWKVIVDHKKIAKLLNQSDLSIVEIAKKAGYSSACFLYDWRDKDTKTTFDRVQKFADVMNVSAKSLLTRSRNIVDAAPTKKPVIKEISTMNNNNKRVSVGVNGPAILKLITQHGDSFEDLDILFEAGPKYTEHLLYKYKTADLAKIKILSDYYDVNITELITGDGKTIHADSKSSTTKKTAIKPAVIPAVNERLLSGRYNKDDMVVLDKEMFNYHLFEKKFTHNDIKRKLKSDGFKFNGTQFKKWMNSDELMSYGLILEFAKILGVKNPHELVYVEPEPEPAEEEEPVKPATDEVTSTVVAENTNFHTDPNAFKFEPIDPKLPLDINSILEIINHNLQTVLNMTIANDNAIFKTINDVKRNAIEHNEKNDGDFHKMFSYMSEKLIAIENKLDGLNNKVDTQNAKTRIKLDDMTSKVNRVNNLMTDKASKKTSTSPTKTATTKSSSNKSDEDDSESHAETVVISTVPTTITKTVKPMKSKQSKPVLKKKTALKIKPSKTSIMDIDLNMIKYDKTDDFTGFQKKVNTLIRYVTVKNGDHMANDIMNRLYNRMVEIYSIKWDQYEDKYVKKYGHKPSSPLELVYEFKFCSDREKKNMPQVFFTRLFNTCKLM